MRYKTTFKEIKVGYLEVYCCDYNAIKDIDYLLSPEAYNEGIYGHNYDVYGFGHFAITIGNRAKGIKLNKTVIDDINKIVYKYNSLFIDGQNFDESKFHCICEIEMLLHQVFKDDLKGTKK